MPAHSSASADAWFHSVDGRRYKRHFGWLIVAKAVLLATLYFLCIAPQTRADTSPDAVRRRIVPESTQTPATTQP
ncbi:MAG: hypothetical protein ABI846_11395 [Rudaea sp.]